MIYSPSRKTVNKEEKQNEDVRQAETKEMQAKALTALPQDQRSVPSMQIQRLTTTCISSSKGPNALVCPWWAHTHRNTHTNKNTSFILSQFS